MFLTDLELSILNINTASEATVDDIKFLIDDYRGTLRFLDPIDDEDQINEYSDRVDYLYGFL